MSLPPFPEDLGGFRWNDHSHERPAWSSESDLFNEALPPDLWDPPPEFDEPEWSSADFWPDDSLHEWPDPPESWDEERNPEGWNPDIVHDEPPPDGPKQKRNRRGGRVKAPHWELRGLFATKEDLQNYLDRLPFLDAWVYRRNDGWWELYVWSDTQ